MTIHMIRVIVSPGGLTTDELQTTLDDWVSKNSEWTADDTDHTVNESPETGWRLGNYRFTLDDAKDNLLQKCEDKLQTKVDWYRLGYHRCDHDETDPVECTWDDEREWSDSGQSIPAGVPDFV